MVTRRNALRRSLRRRSSASTGKRCRMGSVSAAKSCRLFVYGTLLPGEREHALLGSAELLGPACTEPKFQLVDLGMYAALVADGKVAVHGELYALDLQTRRA